MADLTNAEVSRNLMGAINKMAAAGGSADVSKQLTIQSSILASIKQTMERLLDVTVRGPENWHEKELLDAEIRAERRKQDQMLMATLGKLTKSISKKEEDDNKKVEADDSAFYNLNIGVRLAAAGVAFLYGTIKGFVDGMRGMLGKKFNAAKIFPGFTNLIDSLRQIFNNIKLSIFKGVANAFDRLNKFYTNFIKALRVPRVGPNLGPMLANVIENTVKGIQRIIKGFGKARMLINSIPAFFELLATNIKLYFSGRNFPKLARFFTKIKNGLFGFVDLIRSMPGKINESFITPFQKVGAFIEQAKAYLGIVTKEGGFFSSIRTFFTTLKSPRMLKLMTFFSDIGKSFGKILAPLGFIFSAFAGIKNAIAVFNDSDLPIGIKIIKALAGFVGGFVGNFVGGIVDAIKSVISWILEKLGFEAVSKFLDSFSFEELITAGFNDLFKLPIDWLNKEIEKIANIFYSEDSFSTKVMKALDWLMDGLYSIIALPVDLVKSFFAGLLGMFGADKLQEMLNAWDFKTLFTEQWKRFKGFLGLGDSTPTNVEPITPEYAQKQAALNKRIAERDAERAKQRITAITNAPVDNSRVSQVQITSGVSTTASLQSFGGSIWAQNAYAQ